MSNRFGIPDSLLDAVKNVQSQEVSKHAAFGYVTEKKKMDPVGGADADIDNDGDVDKSDKYLHNRRKAIKKAMGGKKDKVEVNPKDDNIKEAYDEEIEDKVSDKHGLNAAHHHSDNGHHAVAVEPDHRGDKMGKSSLGDHDTHSHHIVLHPGNKETHVKLPNGKKATADHVAKQVPNAPASIHKAVANYHNMGESVKEGKDSGLENPHNCATHVYSEQWGDGTPVKTMHADPDEAGNIAWYDVMFEHGVEKRVPIEELKVIKSSHHGHKKRGMK